MKNQKVQGIIKRHPDGFGFLIPDDPENPDLYLSRQEMRGIMTNDRVQARMQREKSGDRFFGVDLEVLERL